MGHNNVIYGGIEEIEGGFVYHQRRLVRRVNERVIGNLPAEYDGDPPLIPSMFRIPKLNEKRVYRSRTITFGASFNAVWFDVEEWLTRFERLLARLYWSNATMSIWPDLAAPRVVVWTSRMWELKLLPVSDETQVPPPTTEWRRQTFDIGGE